MGLFINKPNHPKNFLGIPSVISLVIVIVWMFTIIKCYLTNRTGTNKNLLSGTYSTPPVVPGLPLLGNLLRLKDKVTHHTFANWVEIYGPIYSIKAGASNFVVLSSPDVAKEAMVTKFSFISKRKQTNAMSKLTNNIIITRDSNEYHKMARRHVVTHMLGADAQRRHRAHRDIMIDYVVNGSHAHAKENPVDQPVKYRQILLVSLIRR